MISLQRMFALRIQRGMQWLNYHHPSWMYVVNPYKFDITSGCDCIIGQIYKLYNHGPFTDYEDLGQKTRLYQQAIHLGFHLENDKFGHDTLLTQMWQIAILKARDSQNK